MSYNKLQGRRAIDVINNDDGIKIPTPASKKSNGTTDGTTATKLVDSTVDFIALGIKPNDIIYNTTDDTVTTVQQVDDANTLSVRQDIFTSGETYIIYDGQTTDGPVLYVGTGGTLTLVTVGLDRVIFRNVPNGTFLPVQVHHVEASTTAATDIIALW